MAFAPCESSDIIQKLTVKHWGNEINCHVNGALVLTRKPNGEGRQDLGDQQKHLEGTTNGTKRIMKKSSE